MNWLRIVGSLLLIIGCAENPFKVKGKCRTIEMKAKCSITAEQQRVLLIYHLYKTIPMDALAITLPVTLLTMNNFHHFS